MTELCDILEDLKFVIMYGKGDTYDIGGNPLIVVHGISNHFTTVANYHFLL